jgi:hypothetical protein
MVAIEDEDHDLGSFFFGEVGDVHEGAFVKDGDVSLSYKHEELFGVEHTGVLANNFITY